MKQTVFLVMIFILVLTFIRQPGESHKTEVDRELRTVSEDKCVPLALCQMPNNFLSN